MLHSSSGFCCEPDKHCCAVSGGKVQDIAEKADSKGKEMKTNAKKPQ